MRLFETFWIAPKDPPSFVSIFCNTMDVKKLQRVPLFTFFGTVTLFKNLNKIFFWEIFLCPQRVTPSIFFMFCNKLEFHKARRVPPFQFWALDMAPTLAVLGLLKVVPRISQLFCFFRTLIFNTSKLARFCEHVYKVTEHKYTKYHI